MRLRIAVWVTSRLPSILNNRAYAEAVNALFTQLPMFQRQGPAAYKADLSATRLVCSSLGHPEHDLKFIHVAGTNGKGTVCHMVAGVLQEAGFRVGLFTSPHLVDFRERIRVNGQCIPEASVVEFVAKWQASEGAWGTPSFFELTLGMALSHFEQTRCDIVLLETGMGGRLDSTNVILAPEVAVVTNIGLDHQAFLGSEIRDIAREKAGIFKDGVPVVLGPMRPEAQSEMLAAALRSSSEVHFARDLEAIASKYLDAESSFVERMNLSTALATVQVLKSKDWTISEDAVRSGFAHYARLTGQFGRWQQIQILEQPLVILDAAHNEDGVGAVLNALREKMNLRGGQLWVIWGAVADKDHSTVMSILPKDANYVWCQADIPRAMATQDIAAIRQELSGIESTSPIEALQYALNAGSEQDVIWVGGSLFVVGNVLRDAPHQIEGWP